MGEENLVIRCLRCGTKNRIPSARLHDYPVCGQCHASLDDMIIHCLRCGTKNKIPEHRLHEKPLCGVCGAAIVAEKTPFNDVSDSLFPSDDDIQEKQVYQCSIFSVYEGEIRFPNGRVAHQSRIDHLPCIAVVPIDKEGRVILVKQYRYSVRKPLIEIPAGNMDKGNESPEVCARRELSEETGYGANRWIPLYEGYLLPGYCNEYMYFYLAADLYPAPLEPDDDEFFEILSVPIDEAMEMIKAGKIIDAKTALGLYMARDYLKNATHGNY